MAPPAGSAAVSPAPFLKNLRAPQAAAAAPATPAAIPAVHAAAPANRAAAGDDEDPGPEFAGPVSDESFESAAVVPRSALADRDVDRAGDGPELKAPPPLEDVVARVPAETRKALDEIFRARFRTVRRITPDQLR